MDIELQTLTSRLLAHGYLTREDKLVRRALTDETFREELDLRLSQCGMQLLQNPYADTVAIGLKRECEEAVFGGQEVWLNNNMGLSRDAVALLIVLWSQLILPKREKQAMRHQQDQQAELFAETKPKHYKLEEPIGIAENTLYADFAEQLGGKARMGINLGSLSRLGFISRRNKVIYEGPLLDVLLDYSRLAPRIIGGALEDLLAKQHALIEED